MNEDKLHKHIHETYHVMRLGLAVIAAVFPVLLVLAGYGIYGIPPQKTMSHYYFALQDPAIWSFPMRGLFVGVFCAVGCALILYRGYSNTENWLLNLAGVFIIGVLVHMGAPNPLVYGGHVIPVAPWAHKVFAILFFVAIILVAVACSEETLGDLPEG